MPFKIGGTVTVDGTQITQATDSGYTFRVTRPDGGDFIDNRGRKAEDTNGLNESDYYTIDIPIYDANEQPEGAKSGDKAVIRVFRNGAELTVESPENGQITIGESGAIEIVNISVASNHHPPVDENDDGENDDGENDDDPAGEESGGSSSSDWCFISVSGHDR